MNIDFFNSKGDWIRYKYRKTIQPDDLPDNIPDIPNRPWEPPDDDEDKRI